MHFHTTIGYLQAEQKWEDAYAAHDAFAEAGDDGILAGGTAEADAASKAEADALNELLHRPAVTPTEIARKIGIIDMRYAELSWEDLETEFEQIKTDLIEQTRPNASPAIAEAFETFAQAHRHFWERGNLQDADLRERGDRQTEAMHALLGLPCITPGDFLVKRAATLLDEFAYDHADPFLCAVENMTHITDRTAYVDLRDSDLGCCIFALGRVQFDAAEWVKTARRHGKQVTVMIGPDERRALYLGTEDMTGPDSIGELLQRLTANGLGEVSKRRVVAIVDEIEANHSDLVIRHGSEPAEQALAEATAAE